MVYSGMDDPPPLSRGDVVLFRTSCHFELGREVYDYVVSLESVVGICGSLPQGSGHIISVPSHLRRRDMASLRTAATRGGLLGCRSSEGVWVAFVHIYIAETRELKG